MKNMKKKVFVLAALALVLCSSLAIPCAAALPDTYTDRDEGVTVYDYELMLEGTYPYAGDTEETIGEVYTYLAFEPAYEGINANMEWIQREIFAAMRNKQFSSCLPDDEGNPTDTPIESVYVDEVFVYDVDDSGAPVWLCCSDYPLYSASEAIAAGLGNVYPLIDIYVGNTLQEYTSHEYTLAMAIESLSGSYNVKYAVRSVRPFAIRYRQQYGDGSQKKFCIICAPYAFDDANTSGGGGRTAVYAIGRTAYQMSLISSGTVDAEAIKRQYENTIKNMEASHAQELVAAQSAARADGYAEGYEAARDDYSDGNMVDTSTPTKTLLGFCAILFKNVRDFAMPFLTMEFFGFTLYEVIGFCIALAFIAVIVIIAKVFKG